MADLDPKIWMEDWFLDLEQTQKLFVLWLYGNCDCAGIWRPNTRVFNATIGEIDLDAVLKKINSDKERIAVLENGRWFIKSYIHYQSFKKSKEFSLSEKPTAFKKNVVKILAANGVPPKMVHGLKDDSYMVEGEFFDESVEKSTVIDKESVESVQKQSKQSEVEGYPRGTHPIPTTYPGSTTAHPTTWGKGNGNGKGKKEKDGGVGEEKTFHADQGMRSGAETQPDTFGPDRQRSVSGRGGAPPPPVVPYTGRENVPKGDWYGDAWRQFCAVYPKQHLIFEGEKPFVHFLATGEVQLGALIESARMYDEYCRVAYGDRGYPDVAYIKQAKNWLWDKFWRRDWYEEIRREIADRQEKGRPLAPLQKKAVVQKEPEILDPEDEPADPEEIKKILAFATQSIGGDGGGTRKQSEA